MVRYTGRAKTQTGMNTNQVGLKMSGCPSRVGRKGTIIRKFNQRVNCMEGLCGGAKLNGKMWRTTYRNKEPFCKKRSTKCAQAAGGVGRINAPYFNRKVRAGESGCTPAAFGGDLGPDTIEVVLENIDDDDEYDYVFKVSGSPSTQLNFAPPDTDTAYPSVLQSGLKISLEVIKQGNTSMGVLQMGPELFAFNTKKNNSGRPITLSEFKEGDFQQEEILDINFFNIELPFPPGKKLMGVREFVLKEEPGGSGIEITFTAGGGDGDNADADDDLKIPLNPAAAADAADATDATAATTNAASAAAAAAAAADAADAADATDATAATTNAAAAAVAAVEAAAAAAAAAVGDAAVGDAA